MRVVLTRDPGRGASFAGRLRTRGHDVRCVPLTAVAAAGPFPDPAGYDGVLFTSVNAVDRAPAAAAWPRVGAVGPATARALAARGIPVDVVGEGGGRELAAAWGPAHGLRLLLPQAEDAHPALADELRAAGAAVTCAAVYRTVPVAVVERAALEGADVICFFAPSQVRAFLALGVRTKAKLWAHGPTTARALEGVGNVVDDLEAFLA